MPNLAVGFVALCFICKFLEHSIDGLEEATAALGSESGEEDALPKISQ